jgi:hypothetical protein
MSSEKETWEPTEVQPYAIVTPDAYKGDCNSEGGQLPTPSMPKPRPDESRPDPG